MSQRKDIRDELMKSLRKYMWDSVNSKPTELKFVSMNQSLEPMIILIGKKDKEWYVIKDGKPGLVLGQFSLKSISQAQFKAIALHNPKLANFATKVYGAHQKGKFNVKKPLKCLMKGWKKTPKTK